MRKLAGIIPVLIACACAAQSPAPGPSARIDAPIDSVRVLEDLRRLSSGNMQGRATGTQGNAAARQYVEAAFRAAGASPLGGEWIQEFRVEGGGRDLGAANVTAMIRGTDTPERFIVVTAHFDHLGVRGSEIFYGADDNASGTAALLEIARLFSASPPSNSIAFVAFDAEELGLRGAREFIANPPVPVEAMALNINMDMIGRNADDELFIAGTFSYPFLNPIVDSVAGRSRLEIRKGHDRPDGSAGDDWTSQSDHASFHAAGIPFLYLGVEDHPDYHRPTDSFDRLQPGFYVEAVRTAVDLIDLADKQLDSLLPPRSARP